MAPRSHVAADARAVTTLVAREAQRKQTAARALDPTYQTPPWELCAPTGVPLSAFWEPTLRSLDYAESDCDALRAYLASGPHAITGIRATYVTGRTERAATALCPAGVEHWVFRRDALAPVTPPPSDTSAG